MSKKLPIELEPKFLMIKAFALLAACLIVGAVFYHLVEGFSYVDSLYFTSMTLTTVGYGDFTPRTEIGKIFTSIYAFVGIGIFLGFAASLFQATLSHVHRLQLQRHNDNEQATPKD